MQDLTVVLGYGAVGRPAAKALLARGDAVRVAQRNRPADLPAAAQFVTCDVLNAQSVRRAVAGARQVVLAIGFAYDTKVWREAWPRAMTNVVEACAQTGARIVFLDNLYVLGPQTEARREDMPPATTGRKPVILAEAARIWQTAAQAGRIRMAALRCPDFYGPDTPRSHLGSNAFDALARGQPAWMLAPPDTPHDFAYVPDIVRAILLLLDAPDSDFNQVWNMPCAPTRTPREILSLGAAAIGAKVRMTVVPLWLLPVLGLGVGFLREVADVSFTWDRPYIVDASKFTRRFGFEVTPFEVSAPATARAFAALVPDAQTRAGAAPLDVKVLERR